MLTFGEDEWEGPLFTGKHYSHTKTRLLKLLKEQLKGECNAIMIIQILKSRWQLWLIGCQLVTITINGAVVTNKMVIQSQSLQTKYPKWFKSELPFFQLCCYMISIFIFAAVFFIKAKVNISLFSMAVCYGLLFIEQTCFLWGIKHVEKPLQQLISMVDQEFTKKNAKNIHILIMLGHGIFMRWCPFM